MSDGDGRDPCPGIPQKTGQTGSPEQFETLLAIPEAHDGLRHPGRHSQNLASQGTSDARDASL